MSKIRIDLLVFQMGLTDSRERARTEIMSGRVFVNGQRVDKPGTPVDEASNVELRGASCDFVSRGGLKLKKALAFFSVDPMGKTCLDCGASTGGFTDCLLKGGAEKVYAVDVGYGQLAWSIRTDPRVVSLERTNIRYVTKTEIPDDIDLAVIDVSFISLKLVLPAVKALLKEQGEIVCLIKPQFEAGKGKVGKKGVVRDRAVRAEVLENFYTFASDNGFAVKGITFSPIKGPEGNVEFLAHLGGGQNAEVNIEKLLDEAEKELEAEKGSAV